MTSSSTESSTRRLNPALLGVGIFCLLIGLAAAFMLNRSADLPDSSPALERQGLNAPFITTPDLVVDTMVELAEIKDGDVVYDLGCGDGRLVITAAMKSGCTGVGFDIDPERVAEATENAKLHGVADRVEIVEQDIFTVDMSKADVALMYVLPWMMNKLLPQFQQMKDGCRLVAHDFWIDCVEPEVVINFITPDGNNGPMIYLYRTPLVVNPALEKGKPPHSREGEIKTIQLTEPLRPEEEEAEQASGETEATEEALPADG